MFRNINIFEARKEGYKTYRVPGITVTKNDVILVTAEARPNDCLLYTSPSPRD